ncbi:putative RHS-repeat domain protein [Burkholderia pseudomallei MSHR5609]|nr:putative RHS-repeat domain protein [Burkholderia pseudomallei MSHR5609]KGX54086.1 hypothetical protein Y024_5189 [Burkholderia pseudomallei TSV44]KIX33001.1 hypothetical protein SY87_33785 [Burkholderia pseudomallei]
MLDTNLTDCIAFKDNRRRIVDLDRYHRVQRVIFIPHGMFDHITVGDEPGFALGPVAACVVGARNREIVALPFRDHPAVCIVAELDATRRVLRKHEVTMLVIYEAVDAHAVGVQGVRHALFHDAAEPIAAILDGLSQRISNIEQFACGAVPVMPRLAPVIRFLDNPAQLVALDFVDLAAPIDHAHQLFLGVVAVFDDVSVRRLSFADMPKRRIDQLSHVAGRIAVAHQIAIGIIDTVDLAPARFDGARQIADVVVFVTARLP